MKKQIVLIAMLMALIGVNGCNAMNMDDMVFPRPLRLLIDNAAVIIITPAEGNNADNAGVYTITGDAFKGTIFYAPQTDTIGVQFTGELDFSMAH